MESFIRYGFGAEKVPGYDCSVMNRTPEEWYALGEKNYPFGIFFLIYGFLTQFIYLFILQAMWKRKGSNTCYSIMFVLGIYDILNLAVNSDMTGYFLIIGGNYCTHPNLNYISGSIAVSVWCGACLSCLILVVNRLCDLWNSVFTEKMFGGKKVLLWIAAPVFYTLYFSFFTAPVAFNSKMTAWFFNPFILGTPEEMASFHNIPHTVNNLCVVLITSFLYLLLVVLLGHKYGLQGMSNISKVQRSIVIQSVLICSASLAASFLYVYMQFFPVPIWLITVSQGCWQASHGIPAFVYLTLNKTIRADVMKTLHLARMCRVSINISFEQQPHPSQTFEQSLRTRESIHGL